jgi:hypothetical protein
VQARKLAGGSRRRLTRQALIVTLFSKSAKYRPNYIISISIKPSIPSDYLPTKRDVVRYTVVELWRAREYFIGWLNWCVPGTRFHYASCLIYLILTTELQAAPIRQTKETFVSGYCRYARPTGIDTENTSSH